MQAGTGVLRLRLPFRPPIDAGRMLGYLAARAIAGIEVAAPGEYKRTISLPNGCGAALPAPRSRRELGGLLAGAV